MDKPNYLNLHKYFDRSFFADMYRNTFFDIDVDGYFVLQCYGKIEAWKDLLLFYIDDKKHHTSGEFWKQKIECDVLIWGKILQHQKNLARLK